MTKEQAQNELKTILVPGCARLYMRVTHVSRSGMARAIRVWTIGEDREPACICWLIANSLGLSERHDGVWMRGCGMDMGFALADDLAAKLWPDLSDAQRRLKHVWI